MERGEEIFFIAKCAFSVVRKEILGEKITYPTVLKTRLKSKGG